MPLSSVVGAQSIVRPGVCTSSTRPASPYEGQVIYETDTDVMLIWNGSAWVCVTAKTATVLTDQSLSTSSTFSDLSTAGPSVTMTTGTSALVTVSAVTYRSTGTGNTAWLGVAVSGATTKAASSDGGPRTSYFLAGASHCLSGTFSITGLTAGSNTFKLQYYIDGAVTVNFLHRHITVVGLL